MTRQAVKMLISVATGVTVAIQIVNKPVLASNTKPAPCTYANKTRSIGKERYQWDTELAMLKKFVAGYTKFKAEYDKQIPIRKEIKDLSESDRESYFTWRKQMVASRYKISLQAQDPSFYKAIQEGPDGWYSEEKDKQVFRDIFWEYMTHVGWLKASISGYADTDEGSLKKAINDAQGWANGGIQEAAGIKNLTVVGLKKVRSTLHSYMKQMDDLVCPGAWDTTWPNNIHDKAFERYSVAYSAYVDNIGAMDAAISNGVEEQNLAVINRDPRWRYLVEYFSVYRTVGPPGFRCTWGFRGEFSCAHDSSGGLRLYSRGPQR